MNLNKVRIRIIASLLAMMFSVVPMVSITPVTASEGYTLEIFGNANGDDTINMQDVTYTELIILEYRDRTQLADAKYDGRINMQDVTQIELIILGREKELTLIDGAERTVTVKKPVERIITLTASSPEVLRSLGIMDKIVGVDTYTPAKKDFYPELQALPTVGTAWKPDCEAILSLYPDVVFTYSTRPPEDYMDDFEGTDIAVIRFSFHIQDYISEISRLGYVFGEREKAADVIDFHQSYMDLIDEEIEGLTEDEKPRVYLEWNPDYMTDVDSSLHQLCTMAGGINIAADLSGTYPTVESEWVIVQNPDAIVKFPFRSTAAHGYDVDDPSEMEALRSSIMNRVGFEGITAVENGDVYIVGQEIVGGPRTLVAVAYMAKWFHPELFEDLDPQAIHQEYLTELQGLDIDLDEHGVFVYPPLES